MFADRADAARQLAELLRPALGDVAPEQVVLVGLPRGGVPIAAEVGRRLGLQHDAIVVRKLGVPGYRELAMGAIGEGGVRVVNDDVVAHTGATQRDLDETEQTERYELERRVAFYRGGRPRVELAGRVVVVIDDGLATGASARAACQVARASGAARVILAVPVAPPDWIERLAGEADEFVAVATPASFSAVGQFYDDFGPVSDADVVDALR